MSDADWSARTTTTPRYPDVGAWVDEWLLTTYQRTLNGHRTWCARWREHPEAVQRLEAMWAAWQRSHDDPIKLGAWWLTVADPHLAVLLDPDGPFSGCRAGENARHRPPEPWPSY